MKRILAAVMALSLVAVSIPAQAHYHHMIIKPIVGGSSSGGSSGGAGGAAACSTGCGIVVGFIGLIAAMIVADEVKRSIEGPACATMKQRKSWFGMVTDEPKLWRPLCKHQKKVFVKLWPNGK